MIGKYPYFRRSVSKNLKPLFFRIRKQLIRKGVQKKAFNTGNLFKRCWKSLKGKRTRGQLQVAKEAPANSKVVLPEPRSQGCFSGNWQGVPRVSLDYGERNCLTKIKTLPNTLPEVQGVW